MGSSLCVLFNATQPTEPIEDARLSPSLKTVNDCKAATFHFLKGIKQELQIDGDDAFMIHNLYSDDTNGFVKVRRYRPALFRVLFHGRRNCGKAVVFHKGGCGNPVAPTLPPLRP